MTVLSTLFIIAVLWLATLSETWNDLFGGRDWRINDIHRWKLAECYVGAACVLSIAVPFITRSPLDYLIGVTVLLVVLLHNRLGLRLGLPAFKFIAIATLAMFMVSSVFSQVTPVVYANTIGKLPLSKIGKKKPSPPMQKIEKKAPLRVERSRVA